MLTGQNIEQNKNNMTLDKEYYTELWKIPFLLVLTLGFYSLYWVYQAWKFIKLETNKKISPAWRTFSIIFPIVPLTMLFYELIIILSSLRKINAIILSLFLSLFSDISTEYAIANHLPLEKRLVLAFINVIPLFIFQNLINKYTIQRKRIVHEL